MQVQPPREGALVVKIYFAKRKLVWEILENALKKKIEIQWSDVIGVGSRFGAQAQKVWSLGIMSSKQ